MTRSTPSAARSRAEVKNSHVLDRHETLVAGKVIPEDGGEIVRNILTSY